MSIGFLIGALVYLGMFVYFWRRWSWDFAHALYTTRGEAVFFGFINAVVWPMCFFFRTLPKWDGFFLAPKAVRREEEKREMQDRIRELERELNL